MNEIISLDDFLKLPVERAKDVMLDLSRNISDQRLAQEWSTQINYVRKLRCLLGIHKDHSGGVTSVSEIKCEKWPPTLRPRSRQPARETEKVVPIPVVNFGSPEEQLARKVKSFIFSLEGVFTAEELNNRIEAIKTLMTGSSDSRYALSISLEEIIPGENQKLAATEANTSVLRETEEL